MHKKIYIIALLTTSIFTFNSCDVLEEVASTVVNPTNNNTANALTDDEIIGGLKEALVVGIKNSVISTSQENGFWSNAEIKLPFPQDAIKVKEKALDWGLTGQVEKFELTLNKAAEEASKEATPIFVDAITNMTFADARGILKGGDGAATKFLKEKTTAQLVTAFSPKVQAAIEKVKLTDYWNPIITKYNNAMKVTGGQQLNPDLNKYVTELAIKGLFNMVEKEENKIRKDPMARVTDILKKVFGSLTN